MIIMMLVLVVVPLLMVVAMVLMTMLVVVMVVVLLLMVVAMVVILLMLMVVVVVVLVILVKLIMMMRCVNEVCLLPALYMFFPRRAECVWVLPILLTVWTAPALKDAEYIPSLCVHRKQLSCLPLQLLARYMFRFNTVKLKQNLWMHIVSHLLSANMVCSDCSQFNV